MFFSATLDGEVAELARAYTHNPSRFDAQLPSHLERGETEPVRRRDRRSKVETLVDMLGTTKG
jgi:superfamily II DNA/RNA helicase